MMKLSFWLSLLEEFNIFCSIRVFFSFNIGELVTWFITGYSHPFCSPIIYFFLFLLAIMQITQILVPDIFVFQACLFFMSSLSFAHFQKILFPTSQLHLFLHGPLHHTYFLWSSYSYHFFLCFQHFCHVLTCMRRPQGRGLELARKHIASCISELGSILNSAEFLMSNAYGTCEDGTEDRTTASGRQAIGFDANLNSRISAPTPPRSIKILSWKKVRTLWLGLFCFSIFYLLIFFVFLFFQAIEYFEKLLHHLDIICSYLLDPSLDVLLRFVAQFQKAQPDLVARVHLQVIWTSSTISLRWLDGCYWVASLFLNSLTFFIDTGSHHILENYALHFLSEY